MFAIRHKGTRQTLTCYHDVVEGRGGPRIVKRYVIDGDEPPALFRFELDADEVAGIKSGKYHEHRYEPKELEVVPVTLFMPRSNR